MKRYNYEFDKNINKFAFDFAEYLISNNKNTPVFLCIGETTVLTDCLGAMVGHLLKSKYHINAFVYGDLKNNINQTNLYDYYDFAQSYHKDSPIVVIDASLGNLEDVGTVLFKKSGSLIGGFTNKYAKQIGDVSVLGTLNTTGINSLLFLKSVKLKNLMNMADFIAKSISLSFSVYESLKKTKQQYY